MQHVNNYKNLNQEQFYKLLNELDDYYFNDQPLVSDAVYDILFEEYQNKFGPYKKIGAPPRNEAVTMPYPLPSLDKFKTSEKIARFQERYQGDYIVEDKIDGVSMLYISGPKPKLFTRGGGTEGEDKSFLLKYLNLPKPNCNVAVRGEMVITRDVYQRYSDRYARPLNMVTGIVNSKEGSIEVELIKELKFFAYRLFNGPENIRPFEERSYLHYLGFQLPKFNVFKTLSLEELNKTYFERDAISPYDMDGLVIYSNNPLEINVSNPKTAFAYKPDTETAVVKVTGVEWGDGTWQGKLKPVVLYENTYLSGGNLTRATAYNARYVVENKLGPDATILIVRSGGNIPDILQVIEPSPYGPQMPNIPYYWDKNEVDILSTYLTRGMVVDLIVHFLTTLGVKTFGPGRVEKLVDAGVRNLDDFLSLTADQVSTLEGFKDLPYNFFTELWRVLGQVKLSTIAAASGFFPNVAVKRWTDICEMFPNILQWDTRNKDVIAERIKQVKGIDTLAENIAENLGNFFDWLKKWPQIRIMEETKKTGQLSGRIFVFTGIRDGDMSQKIIDMGGTIRDNVSKVITDLIYDGNKAPTNSYNKAVEYGKNLIEYHTLKRELGL